MIEELRIDVEGAEVVDQDSDALICECKQVVEQRGLAGAEVAPDDRDGDERFLTSAGTCREVPSADDGAPDADVFEGRVDLVEVVLSTAKSASPGWIEPIS